MLSVLQDFGVLHAQLVSYITQVPVLPVSLLLQVVQFILQQQHVQHAIKVSTLLVQQVV